MTCPPTYDPGKLYTELLGRNSRSAGSGLKAVLPAGGGEKSLLGCSGPLDQSQ